MLLYKLYYSNIFIPRAPHGGGHGPDGEIQECLVVQAKELLVHRLLDNVWVDFGLASREGAPNKIILNSIKAVLINKKVSEVI